jgi:hypothetical protein
MKRIVSVALAAGAALALTAAAAQAQVSIGVGGGLSIPTGTLKDGVKTGWNALANVGYDLPSGLGVRGDFYYAQHKFKGGSSGKFKFAGGFGNLLYNFKTPGTVHPYILGSVGFMNAKADVTGGASETKIAFGGGAGIKFKIGSDASLFAEGRYITVNTSGDNANFIPLTVGVSFGLK